MKKYVPLIAVLIALTACTDTAQTDNAETTIKVKVTEATEASEDEPVMVSEGSIDAIPADIRTQPEEMSREAETQNVQTEVVPQCAPSTGFSFELPAGWSYTSTQTEDEPTSSISAYLSPDNEAESTITIEYSKNFAVCGTGLVQKPIDFNGYSATQCYYDGSENWSFIMLDGEYTESLNAGKFNGFKMDIICFLKTVSSVLKHDGVVEGGTGELEKEKEKIHS